MPRIKGSGKHDIKYRHIIDSLIRKPGAFENYKYKENMFPTTRFRIVYDVLLKNKTSRKAAKEYLLILNLAAKESESLVDESIHFLLQENGDRIIDFELVKGVYETLKKGNKPRLIDIQVEKVNLKLYDHLFKNKEESGWISVN